MANTPIFVQTTTAQPNSLAGSIYIENAQLINVPIAVGTTSGITVLAGGTTTILSWAQGNVYLGNNASGQYIQANVTRPLKPASLLDPTGKVFGQARPQYEAYSPNECELL